MRVEDLLREEITRLRGERDDARVEADSYRADAFRWRAQEECRRREDALDRAAGMVLGPAAS